MLSLIETLIMHISELKLQFQKHFSAELSQL